VSESGLSAAARVRPSRIADEDDIAHVVCCRDPAAWLGGVLKALCGAEEEDVMLTAKVVCSMCVEEINRMRPGWRSEVEDICPIDGRPCPDELALLDLVARRVLPD
jgi:hypothetical protein